MDTQSPFPARLATTYQVIVGFDWLDLEREVAALHLEGMEEEDHLHLAGAILLDRALALNS